MEGVTIAYGCLILKHSTDTINEIYVIYFKNFSNWSSLFKILLPFCKIKKTKEFH